MTCAGTTRNSLALVAMLALAAAWTACSEGSDDGTTPGAAGSTPSSTGGTTSSSGGSTGMAGSDGASGATGTGGTSGTVIQEWTFDADLEEWAVASYSEPADLAANTTAEWYAGDGDPVDGSIRVTIPYTDAEQKAQVSLLLSTPLDLTGRTLSIRVKLDSGLTSDLNNPGGIKVFAKDGSDVWANGLWQNLEVEAGWVTATFVADMPDYNDGYDPTNIVEIGVEIVTGSTSASFETAMVHLDTVQISS